LAAFQDNSMRARHYTGASAGQNRTWQTHFLDQHFDTPVGNVAAAE